MYKLLIEDDEGGKTAVSLIRDEITIGRKEGNTIRLTDRNVSRRHGRIVREDDRVFVEDVEARYGIKKNGQKIDDRAEFEEGDVIVIGDYELTLKPDKSAKKEKPDSGDDIPQPPADDEVSDDFSDNRHEQTQIMQAMPASLVVISSNFAGEEFTLAAEEMVIGRSDDCDIIIDHRSISSRHAKIVREDNVTYKIVDLNSKNGVKVSGDEYQATILKRGDVVELGHVKIRFVEPGENYVFDPEAAKDPVPVPTPDDGPGLDPTKMGLIVGGLAAVVLAVGVLVLFPSGDDPDDTGETDEQIADIEDLDEGDDEGISEIIDAARADIEQGELSGPMTRLEMLGDVADPSAEQTDEIDDLLEIARNEQPFKDHYENAREQLDDDAPLEALNALTAIPSHSLFYDRARQQGLDEQIFDATLDLGRQALDQEEFDETRAMANEVIMVTDYPPATELLEAADEQEQEATEEEEEPIAAETDSAPTASADGGQPATDPSPQPQPDPDPQPQPEPQPQPDPGLTAEEARQKYTQAAQAYAAGNTQESIDICSEALDAGHTDCHRILGLAYARIDDSSSACRHFEQYLATNPSNPGAVESQMDNQGC